MTTLQENPLKHLPVLSLIFISFIGVVVFGKVLITQTTENRSAAFGGKRILAPLPVGEPQTFNSCFNRVITSVNGSYNWPNGCRGNTKIGVMCTQVITPLSDTEIAQYKAWVAAGRPNLPESCYPKMTSPTPTSKPRVMPVPLKN